MYTFGNMIYSFRKRRIRFGDGAINNTLYTEILPNFYLERNNAR